MKGSKVCELCSKEAAVFCDADHAFLCWTCDAQVHRANFLVARHLRQPLCSSCQNFAGEALFGVDLRSGLRSAICRSCSPEEISGEVLSSDLSSMCELRLGSSEKTVKSNGSSSSSVTEISGEGNDQKRHRAVRSVDAKAEGIFGNWCRELGLNGHSSAIVVSVASHALRLCVDRSGSRLLPLRLSLTASFWCGVKSLGLGSRKSPARGLQALRRLVEISGVPAKLILAVGLKISREIKAVGSQSRDLAEGWDECSG